MDITEARAHAGALLGAEIERSEISDRDCKQSQSVASARGSASRPTRGDRTPGWIEDRAQLIIPHYIWTWQDGRKKHGWCTSCGRTIERLDGEDIRRPDEYMEEGEFLGRSSIRYFYQHWDGTAGHKKTGLCPYCGQEVEFRSLARGHATMEDKLFFVVYRRSAIDRNAIVCAGYRIFIPWRDLDEYERFEVPMQITPMELCVFRWGKGGQRFIRDSTWRCYQRTPSGRDVWTKHATDTWARRKECISGYTGQTSYMGNDSTAVVLDVTALTDAVEGTPWKYCLDHMPWTSAGEYYDHITLMDRISRYRPIEYLLKMGCDELARIAVDHKGGDVLNLRGKTARAVLRLTEDEWGWIKGHKVRVTEDLLRVLKFRRAHKLRMGLDLCRWMAESRGAGLLEAMKRDYKAIDLVQACKYARRQQADLRTYWDYLGQCRRLGADLEDRQVLWPTDLHRAHQRYTDQINQLEAERRALQQRKALSQDAETVRKLAETVKRLAGGYTFRACGLVLSPFETVEEIVTEGAKQGICIGSYVTRYATGGTIICKLRHADKPDTPWHAVEFSATSGAMVQCRGRGNQTDDTDEQLIRDFWAAWDAARGTKTKVTITVRATEKRE